MKAEGPTTTRDRFEKFKDINFHNVKVALCCCNLKASSRAFLLTFKVIFAMWWGRGKARQNCFLNDRSQQNTTFCSLLNKKDLLNKISKKRILQSKRPKSAFEYNYSHYLNDFAPK